MDALIHLVIYILVAGCILGLLLYLLSISPIPEPFKGWAWFLIIAIVVIAIIFYVLLPMLGSVPSVHLGR